MKRTTALLGSAVMVAATMLATLPAAANAAPLTHDQQLALVPPAVTAAGLRDDQLSVWYLDEGNTLHVGLTSYTTQQAEALVDRLGTDTVITQEDQPEAAIGHAPKSSAAAKQLLNPSAGARASAIPASGTPSTGGVPGGLTVGPYEPFLTVPTYPGGVRIIRDAGDEIVWCSTTALWGGKMLFAGHCGPNGAKWQQGYYDNGTIASSGSAGTASSVHWEANNPDVALLSGGNGFDKGVYLNGDKGNVTYAHIAGAAVSAIGATICTDGTTTGYVCNAKVNMVNGCTNMTEEGKTVHECGIDSANNPNAIVTRPGDSGGPVLAPSTGGKFLVTGTISAESNGGHTVYYSNANRIKQILGTSVTVG
ncbi:hypothetical protein [Curtobacterium sp. PhB78]|uniref:hypothetical protein n=1 Tax=Curtobacterium sp. PhB78 TaxID=2485102 RepID=UPI000FBF4EB4|nr:hypothetical protein [Curtobacterium sp. PhB78]ROS36448.1 hypothetical protein EDF53_2416 [Curtobacterium sp. PhB78]